MNRLKKQDLSSWVRVESAFLFFKLMRCYGTDDLVALQIKIPSVQSA